MTNGTVLIFGAAGFVGPWLAREFLAHGYRVAGSDIAPAAGLPPEAEYARADLCSAEEVREVMARFRPHIVVNLAAVSSVSQSWRIPRETYDVNVIGALNLMQAALAMDEPPRLLTVGSSEEYAPCGGPIDEDAPLGASSPYGLSKIAQEQLAGLWRERYGLRITSVRSFSHTGPGQTARFVLPSFARQAARAALGGSPAVIRTGSLGVRRDFSHVEDVVRAYRLAAERGESGRVYNVGSGEAHALSELLDHLISLTGRPVRVETDPALVRPGEAPLVLCDNGRLRRELGWEPRKTVFDALRELYAEALREAEGGAP